MTPENFEKIYRDTYPTLWRFVAVRVADADAARDIVQDCYVALWEAGEAVQSPLPWLRRAAMNAIVDRSRRDASRLRYIAQEEEPPYTLPLDREETERLYAEVDRTIDTGLTVAVRRVVDCVYRQGLSYSAAARELGISVATVNKHVVAALRLLRERFKNRKYED